MLERKIRNIKDKIFGKTYTSEIIISSIIIVIVLIGTVQLVSGELYLPISLFGCERIILNYNGYMSPFILKFICFGITLSLSMVFIPYLIFSDYYKFRKALYIELRSLVVGIPAYFILSFVINTISMI